MWDGKKINREWLIKILKAQAVVGGLKNIDVEYDNDDMI